MNQIFNRWITAGGTEPFYARKEFRVSKEVARATAKVCGLGQFVFRVNGQKVGDHELDPGWTNYRKLVQYVTFDITGLLRPGRNVLGAEVGNGWYVKSDEHYTFSFPEFMPPNPNGYKPYGNSLILGLTLTITYADGSEEIVSADESWQVSRHPVTMATSTAAKPLTAACSSPAGPSPDSIPPIGNRPSLPNRRRASWKSSSSLQSGSSTAMRGK